MMKVLSYIADLLRGGTSIKEAKRLPDSTSGDKLLKTREVYKILKQTRDSTNIDDRSKLNSKRSILTATLVATVTDDEEGGCLICFKTLALVHGTSTSKIFAILHEDHGLITKSSIFVPKLLS
jgi:hypothetical protein